MSSSSEGDKCKTAGIGVAIILALVAIGLSGAALCKYNSLDSTTDKVDKRLEILKKKLANLTNKSKIERAVTNHNISFLTDETKELKVDYMNLLSETEALNKTINYTTSATVQRVLDELNDVKETQRGIQKSLQALSHLNDTAEDYLNLREKVENLTTHVNQNINRLEGRVNENRREWQDALENKTSKIDLKILVLKKRFDRIENAQNKTNVTADATGLRPGLRKASYLLFYTTISLTSLGIVAHS